MSNTNLQIKTADGKTFENEQQARNAGYRPCQDCGEWHLSREMIYALSDGALFCDEACANSAGYVLCDACNHWYVKIDGIVTDDDRHYCTERCAMSEEYVLCDGCLEWTLEDNIEYTYSWSVYYRGVRKEHKDQFCSIQCAHDSGYELCDHCDSLVSDTDMLTANDGALFCDEACANSAGYVICRDCGSVVDDDIAYMLPDGDYICNDCYEYDYCSCQYCGEVVHRDYICSDDYGDLYCEDCYDLHSSEYVHEYGYTPDLKFFGESATHPYLGIELEIDDGCKKDCAEAVNYEYGERIYMTNDGSLSDNGIELTSHPMTTEEHLSGFWSGVFDIAKREGYTSHDNGRCGLHIHINRSFFGKNLTTQQVAGQKLATLVNRFKHPLMLFSRRDSDNWCKFSDTKKWTTQDTHTMRDKARHIIDQEYGHSKAVNFEHRSTFEVRIFRGTLKLGTFYASIALADALARAAKTHGTVWCETVTWYEFAEWAINTCNIEEARYALANYMHEKELIEYEQVLVA